MKSSALEMTGAAVRAGALAVALSAAGVMLAPHVASAADAAAAGYAIVDRWAVPGDGKWDYLTVDGARGRLYLSRASRVQVLDTATGKTVGEIADTPGVHGIALAPDLGRGFTSNGKADSVTVFELATLKTVAQVKLSGTDPDSIVYEPASKRIYVFNGHSNNVNVIDAVTNKEVATIALAGRPEFSVASGGKIYVNLEDKNSVAVIDVAGGRVASTFPLAGCVEPTGLAIDEAHGRLFSVCHNSTMVVSDAASGRQVARLPIGSHVDAAAYDAGSARVFSSNGDSADVTVVAQKGPDAYSVVGSVATARGSKTMALDPASHRLYVPALNAKGALEMLVMEPTK